MSAFHGAQGKGAARSHKVVKRAAAEARNADTTWERRASFRRLRAAVAASVDEALDTLHNARGSDGGAS